VSFVYRRLKSSQHIEIIKIIPEGQFSKAGFEGRTIKSPVVWEIAENKKVLFDITSKLGYYLPSIRQYKRGRRLCKDSNRLFCPFFPWCCP